MDNASSGEDSVGLHAAPWCGGSFEEFVAPHALECQQCDCRTSSFGICEDCRAMVCSRCIAAEVLCRREPHVGDEVRAMGLAANSNMNGKKGRIVSFDKAKDRWCMRLTEGKNISIKTKNILVVRRA